jgi:uncharacterized protein (TIGR02001 family)
MNEFARIGRVLVAGGAMIVAASGAAFADGESVKDAPVDSGRKFGYSVTVGATSDYVFRGISQNQENPAIQGSLDVTYGLFYAGIWGSNIDFGSDKFTAGGAVLGPKVSAEVDLYAGIKPVWGPVTFDLGVLYYWYPNSDKWANFNHVCVGASCPDQIDYTELKAGYSIASPWIKNLVSGTTLYWSPDGTLESGDIFTLESTAAYTLPVVVGFTPTISGTYGTVYGDIKDGFSADGTREDQYSYWNAGLSLAIEKFTFDFRYWDTDIDVATANEGLGACVKQGLCDERFVFTAKITLP